ncbi:MAG TPA: hypothetical protein VF834_20850 [Streptosporangiaceae bacterium]
MTDRRIRIIAGAGLTIGLVAASYPFLWRNRCLTWGATADEVAMNLPGDELLPDADIVTTRAVAISAPPSRIWPWLVQMGSGRAGAYTYDWIENLLGLDMHSADVILPQFQDVSQGDEFPFGPMGGTMRVEILDPERVCAWHYTEGDWVWILALLPDDGTTRLVSRNRINIPAASPSARATWAMLMEPGSLLMERKMLRGIKDRAERLAEQRPAGTKVPAAAR